MSKKHTPENPASQDVDLGEVYSRTELFIEKNKMPLVVGAIIVAVVLGVLGYKKFIAEPKAKEASELMWKAEYYFEIDSLDKALERRRPVARLPDHRRRVRQYP
jgi:hypothetical protein